MQLNFLREAILYLLLMKHLVISQTIDTVITEPSLLELSIDSVANPYVLVDLMVIFRLVLLEVHCPILTVGLEIQQSLVLIS